jgi:hypothetical protein
MKPHCAEHEALAATTNRLCGKVDMLITLGNLLIAVDGIMAVAILTATLKYIFRG